MVRHPLPIAIAATALSAPLFAADAQQSPTEPASMLVVDATLVVEPAPTPASVKVGPFTALTAVPEGGLACVAGMANVEQTIVAQNSSNVSNNSVNGQSVTGTISIDGQSFRDFSGLSLMNANTGNNVSINASMNVNVSFQQ